MQQKSNNEKCVCKNLPDKMPKKEKLQSKKLTAKTPAVNISVKKINGRSFNSKDQIYNSKELDEKCSTVESETTVILHEKTK